MQLTDELQGPASVRPTWPSERSRAPASALLRRTQQVVVYTPTDKTSAPTAARWPTTVFPTVVYIVGPPTTIHCHFVSPFSASTALVPGALVSTPSAGCSVGPVTRTRPARGGVCGRCWLPLASIVRIRRQSLLWWWRGRCSAWRRWDHCDTPPPPCPWADSGGGHSGWRVERRDADHGGAQRD